VGLVFIVAVFFRVVLFACFFDGRVGAQEATYLLTSDHSTSPYGRDSKAPLGGATSFEP